MAKSPAELLEHGRPLTLSGVADGAEGLVVADLARAVAAQSRPPATSLVVVCRDGPRMAALARALTFFAPDTTMCCNFRPGIASPTTGCRRTPASLPNA